MAAAFSGGRAEVGEQHLPGARAEPRPLLPLGDRLRDVQASQGARRGRRCSGAFPERYCVRPTRVSEKGTWWCPFRLPGAVAAIGREVDFAFFLVRRPWPGHADLADGAGAHVVAVGRSRGASSGSRCAGRSRPQVLQPSDGVPSSAAVSPRRFSVSGVEKASVVFMVRGKSSTHGLQGAAAVQAALVGVVGDGLGEACPRPKEGHGFQAGVEEQSVHVAFHEALAKACDLLVGADGGDRHGRVLRLAHALVGGAAVEHRERAHELDGRFGVLRRQGADGGVEQLVDPARGLSARRSWRRPWRGRWASMGSSENSVSRKASTTAGSIRSTEQSISWMTCTCMAASILPMIQVVSLLWDSAVDKSDELGCY